MFLLSWAMSSNEPMKTRLILSIYTTEDTSQEEFAERLINVWYEHYIQFTPSRAGHYEPLSIEVSSPADLKKNWNNDLYWNRKKVPKGNGVFSHKWGYRYSSLNAKFLISSDKQFALLEAQFHSWFAAVRAEFGYFHLLTPPEADVPLRFGCPQHSFILGAGAYGIKPGMADLGWLTVWNKKAAERFGVHRLADKFDLRTEDNTISLRLTETIQDVAADFAGFCERRRLARQRIGEKHFFRD